MLLFRGELIRDLVTKGHQVHVFCMDFNARTRAELRQLGGIPQDYMLQRHGLNVFSDIRSIYQLSRALRRLKPDILLAYFAKPVVYATLAGVIAGIPKRFGMIEGLGFAFTKHAVSEPLKIKLIRAIQIALYRLAFPFLSRVIFLNSDDQKELSAYTGLKVEDSVLLGGIGVDLSKFERSAPASDLIRFLFVGRLLKEKGIHEFLCAAEAVKSEYPNTEFTVVGGLDSNPGGVSLSRITAMDQQGIIKYVGQVDHVVEYYRACSVFVLPSYREGCPRSTQEAMAVGRAVITTNVPGCRQTVVDGVNGFIVPPWSCSELAKTMKRFVLSPDLVDNMGLQSREIAEAQYDVIKVNKRLMEIIECC